MELLDDDAIPVRYADKCWSVNLFKYLGLDTISGGNLIMVFVSGFEMLLYLLSKIVFVFLKNYDIFIIFISVTKVFILLKSTF